MFLFGSEIWQEAGVNIAARKGILALTQSRTCIVHSLGEILIIFLQASHVRSHPNREYGLTFTKGAESSALIVLCSRLFVDSQSAMKSLCEYSFLKGSQGCFSLNHRKSGTIQLKIDWIIILSFVNPQWRWLKMRVIALLLQILSANLERNHFMQRVVCLRVCVFSLWRIKAERRPCGCVCVPQQSDYLDEVKNE